MGGCYARAMRRLHQPLAALWGKYFGGKLGKITAPIVQDRDIRIIPTGIVAARFGLAGALLLTLLEIGVRYLYAAIAGPTSM